MKGIKTKTNIPQLIQDVQKLTSRASENTNASTCIEIEIWHHVGYKKAQVMYNVWNEHGINKKLKTWPELVKYIEKEVI